MKEGYSVRRWNLMKNVMEYISKLDQQIEIIKIKDMCLNQADYQFVINRLSLMGLAYYKDCGVINNEDYAISLNIAENRYENKEDKTGLLAEQELLLKKSPCITGLPVRLKDTFNCCDKDLWAKQMLETDSQLWNQQGKFVFFEHASVPIYVVPSA
jgi:hypothetical protein